MSVLNQPIPVMDTVPFDVYVKAVSGDPPEGGIIDSASGGEGGWSFAGNLRLSQVTLGAWPKSGSATFERIPLDGLIDPFELGLFEFGPDDQVRVVMVPQADGTAIAPEPDLTGGENSGIVIFEGTLERANGDVRGATSTTEEREDFKLVATDAPSIDNLRPEHLVRGRFTAEGSGATPVLIDGPSLPCVFNRGDEPNMRAGSLRTAEAGQLTNVTCHLFTADDDPGASYWTLAHALRHLVCCWLYGLASNQAGDAQGPLPRSATLEPETYDALFGPAPETPRWEGLDKTLPGVDVQGLGVFDAIERVCAAGGYRCAVLPPMGRPMHEDAEVDRLYQLRIWRAGAGPENALRLANRRLIDDTASAADVLADNSVSRLRVLRDTTRVRNNVIACGRTLIETTVELKPMWPPGDADDLGGSAIGPRQQNTPRDQVGDLYHQKHIRGGKQYEQFGHVGRLWGLDETGAFYDGGLGYTTGPYAHASGGFDWITHLGIDTDGGTDALSMARAANGVTDPIRWARRPRRALKLSRPELLRINQAFRLDVSEDSGSNWYELPSAVATLVRDGFFGIELRVNNLATVNRKTFGADSTQSTAEPEQSWWALITSGALRFRLTCLIEADHAARFDAPIDPGSVSRTPRSARIDTRITEVWQSPSSVLGDQTWARLDDGGLVASTSGGDRTDNLKDLAELVRDERGQMRYSIAAEHWLMDPTQIAIGDTVTGIDGRNVDFGLFSAGSGETRYPSVVGIQINGVLDRQGISIDIGDEAARRGV